jgi:hypothetical protein
MTDERRDIQYIRDVLWPEFLSQFTDDNAEYPEDRPLGAKAEWHGLHRKVGKLKAPVWDGQEWTGRESVRRMFQEIVGHAFLAIASLDYEAQACETTEAPRVTNMPFVIQYGMTEDEWYESQRAARKWHEERAARRAETEHASGETE